MALFPQLGPEYLSEKDRGILSYMESVYAEGITINQSFWGEADTDTRFETGDATLWSDLYGNLPTNNRKTWNFNLIRPIVNMISGYQRRNRKSTIVVPIENADQETADLFSQVLLWNDQQHGVLETISDSFHGAVVTGMNLLQVWLDFRSDPICGDIRVNNCSYNSFLIDPFFRNKDLSDCNYIWKRSFLSKKAVLSLFPNKTDEILNLRGDEVRDGKFQFMPETYDTYGFSNLLMYDEFYYRDFRHQKLLIDTQTNDKFEWPADSKVPLQEFIKLYPQLTVIEQEIPTVNVAIVVQGRVLYHGPNPLGIDDYPFVPVLGYYNPQMAYFPLRLQGVVRGLRDAQYLYNRKLIIQNDILESVPNSGFKFKENALVDPKSIYFTGQGRGIAIKQEADINDVQNIIPPEVPASMTQLTELIGNLLTKISGVNEELLGAAIDDKAGILSMLRQGAGLTTLQILFDNLDYAQKLLGKLRIKIIQSNFTPGKIQRITQKQPTRQFYDRTFGTYDAAVEEGLNTTTQRQMQFAQLIQLRELGVPVPDETLINAVTLQDKTELIQKIQQQQQQQQQIQQQQLQAQLQEQQARTKLAESRAVADEGLGIERISRVKENQALAEERRAESHRDHAAAILDMVKALKEIENIDISQIERLIMLSQNMDKSENIEGNV